MKNFNGTPGPWHIALGLTPNGQEIISSTGGKRVLIVDNTQKTLVEKVANANLVAAAPELLKALQYLIALYMREHKVLCFRKPTPEQRKKCIARGLRAVDKALGL